MDPRTGPEGGGEDQPPRHCVSNRKIQSHSRTPPISSRVEGSVAGSVEKGADARFSPASHTQPLADVDAAPRDRCSGAEHQESRRRSPLGKHTAEIGCGAMPWGQEQSEVLVMAGLARTRTSIPMSSRTALSGQVKKAMHRVLLASRIPKGSSSGLRHGAARRYLWWISCFFLISSVGSWIALSKNGYSMKHSLLAQAGVRSTGDVNVNGLLLSTPVADLQCNPSRKGALRWNNEAFEGCDGKTNWRPLTFCSRSCDIDTATVPCGVKIRNNCDGDCDQRGTGLNMRQCILNIVDTPCDAPVQDFCGNECGLAGEGGCEDSVKAVGDYTIRATGGGQNAAAYTFSVAKGGQRNGEPDDGFYLTYKNEVTHDTIDLTRIGLLYEVEQSGSSPTRSKPFGDVSGMELGNTEPDEESTIRISMFTELVGGYVKIGADLDSEAPSHIFIDGTIEKDCPFLFNAGNYDSPVFMKVCLEAPEGNVSVVLPDAGGVVLTTGNEEDIRSLPGLRGDDSLVAISKNKDKFHLKPPQSPPRVQNCSAIQCVDSPLQDVKNTRIAGCNAMDWEAESLDLFRIIYGLKNNFTDAWLISELAREKLANASNIIANASNINASNISSTPSTPPNPTLLDLADMFAREQVSAKGNLADPLLLLWNGDYSFFEFEYQEIERERVETWNAEWSNWTNYTIERTVTRNVNVTQLAIDYLREREACFACCCAELSPPSSSGKRLPFRADPDGLDLADLGQCPGQRFVRPSFCLRGEAIGALCSDDAACPGGECGYDEDVAVCWEEDLGFRCQMVWDRANLTTAIHFTNPQAYQRLAIPDASGGIISTGNLEDITSMGVQDSPIVARSSPTTTTTIAFMPPEDGSLQQKTSKVMNNTLLIPNEADGILLSTANLDDVTLMSGSITGLGVLEDLHVQGSLVFGDDVMSSGFYLPPVSSSVQYSTPHSGRPASRARPGQLSFKVHESTTVLEFEPSDADRGVTTSQVTVPATDGQIISTGNLEAVTAQSGVITSLDVMELSYLQGGVVAGVKGDAQISLQGRASQTLMFNASHPRGVGEAGFSTTTVGFEMQPGRAADILLPAASGVVITTGNLPDIFAFTGDSLDVSDRALLNGNVTLGTRIDGSSDTAIKIRGYLAGDIVYRDVPDEDPRLARVPFPNTWATVPNSVCGEQFAVNTQPQTSIPFRPLSIKAPFTPQYAERALTIPDGIPPFGTGCREICELHPLCGAVVASNYFRVRLMSESAALRGKESVLGMSIPTPRVENGTVVGDVECFPGYSTDPNQAVTYFEGFVHNFSTYPASKNAVLQNPKCQAVVGVTREEQQPIWQDDWFQLGQLDMRMVGCQPTCVGAECDEGSCSGLDDCSRPDANCAVTIRSHAVGSYLTGSNDSACVGQGAGVGCARWTEAPAVWHLQAYAGGRDLAWHEEGGLEAETHYYRLQRGAVCAEVVPALTTSPEVFVELGCGTGDTVTGVQVKWGRIGGTCGAYGTEADVECVGPDDLMAETCLPHGCDVRIWGRRLYVRAKQGDGVWKEQVLRQCVGGQRLVLQASCASSPYLSNVATEAGEELRMVPEAAVGAEDLSTVWHLHSRLQLHTGEERVARGGFLRDCWVTDMAAQQCTPTANADFDVHVWGRYTSTTLAFSNMSSEQTQTFPDTSGNIISSGNLRDITRLTGLQGQNTFMYQHSHEPGGPVTIVDFVEIGHAPRDRFDGALPQYTREDGSPGHTPPPGGNRRITFPDATGTVITTGNLDDLVFQNLELNGLVLDGTARFFNELGQTAVLNFKNGSRFSGCLNFNQEPKLNPETGEMVFDPLFTQVCVEEPTGINELNLPDASGTILTTGNLLNLPTVGVVGEFFIGGDATIEGNMTWGREGVDAVVSQYSWIDGDAGITFAAPLSTENEGFDVLNLNMPHMGGVDIAIRHYLSYDVRELAVDVQGGEAFLVPVAGTERINQTVCEDVMSTNKVFNYHGLGYFLLQNELVAKTLIRDGIPYWGIEMMGNQTYPACLFLETGKEICAGPQPDPCVCLPPREGSVVSWRPVGIQMVLGEQNSSQCANVACDDSPYSCSAPGDPGCAFDGNTSSVFRSEMESVVSRVPVVAIQPEVQAFTAYGTNLRPDGMADAGQCVLGLRLRNATEITRVRVFPADGLSSAMIGGKVQGSADGSTWIDVLEFTSPPQEGEWNEILVRELQGVKFMWVRYIGPGCEVGSGCRCDVAEWEFHQGRVTQRLTALEAGTRSHFIVAEAVNLHPAGAMVLKCASQRWFPAYQTMHVNELMLPEASGVLLTTGNLEDVTKEAGTISSLKVAGQAEIRGSTVLGSANEDTLLSIEATTMGRTPLSFAGGGVVDAASFFALPDASSDRTILFPPDSAGTIVTTGSLPPINEHVSVVGDTSLRGDIKMDNSVTIGDKLFPSSLLVSSVLSNPFPMTFRPQSVKANEKLTIGVENPTEARSLNLPDVAGTVVTTGNLPDVLESPMFVGDTTFRGGARFEGEDIAFGKPEARIDLEINSAIGGSQPLKFEGRSSDDRTLSLAVEEPSAQNMLFLPDVSGTIITTGNFPDVVENLEVLGDLLLEGDTSILGNSTIIGHCELKTQLAVHDYIRGRYPLVFSPGQNDDQAEGAEVVSTSFEITPPTGDNVLSFPDISGTVITTGNIPNSISIDSEYSITVGRFLGISSSVILGNGAAEPKHAGSFVFADASSQSPSKAFSSARDNSFNVRATGGVRFVTGYTNSGRELGVVLEPSSSAWSVLSDENSKIILSPLDHVATLRTLVNEVPITTWSYEGDEVRHMGPMAQDLYKAFRAGESSERISSVDIDGIALSAAKGMDAVMDGTQRSLSTLRETVAETARMQAEAAAEQAELDKQLEHNADLLERLERMLGL